MNPAAALLFATVTSTSAPLTTEVRPETDPGLDLPVLVLRLPQHLMELAFVPLMPVATIFEKYDVVGHLFDLFTNDDKTIGIFPIIVPFNASGVGLGAAFLYNDPLGSADRFVLTTLIRENRDRTISFSFSRRFPSFGGRTVSLSANYDADHDQRYFGIGPKTRRDQERLMRVDEVGANLGVTVFAPRQYPEYTASLRLGYLRRRLAVGTGDRAPSVAPNDVVAVPAGFGRTLDYPALTLESVYDSRDSFGRTTKGFVGRLASIVSHDVNGAASGGVRVEGTVAGYIPLLPLYRTFFVSLSAAGTIPLNGGDDPPLHMLVDLGGSDRLRGLVNDRFLGRLGWWATAEWRYRFYEYAASTMGLSAVLFADVGQVGDEPEELWSTPLPWSVGFSLRAEQNLILLGRMQVAYSNEGFRFSVGAGEVF